VGHEEADLISQCQMGDQAAMKEIFDKYRDKVYRVAYGVVRHREEAMDIVQEVFVKLFLTIGNFKGKSSFYTYVYRTAMNTAIDHVRKLKKSTSLSFEDDAERYLSDGPEKRPDQVAMDKELEEKVKGALAKLPDDQRAAIIFREVEGLSYQEMAKAMDCSMGTVMSRLHYGRKKLQQLLRGYVKEGGKT